MLDVEIYPYKKFKRPHNKKIDSKIICNTTELIDYTQKKYISLFKSEDPEPIIKETLIYTIKKTNSKNGFLALVSDDESTFNYYSIVLDIDGVNLSNCDKPTLSIDIKPGSLISIPFLKKITVISNNVEKDPRARKEIFKDPTHPKISKFLGIPLKYNNKVIGQLGLANSEKYTLKNIESIVPLIQFFQNFIYLVKNNSEMSISQEMKAKIKTAELKDTFMASMSHEMRTPLNGMLGMTRLLSESKGLSQKQEKYVKIISECGTQLLELINDILDFSRITTGDMNLHLSSFNFKNAVESCIAMLQQKALEKNLTLNLKADFCKIPETINSDSRRIKQVIINLLTNAIKFTEKGWVELRIDCEKYDNFRTKLVFEIEDTGIGIKQDDHEKLFKAFSKAQNDRIYSYDNPGAGLGLVISKEICRLMGGDITFTSTYKVGSIFKFYIYVDDETDIDMRIEENKELFLGKRIICVDDNVDNRMFLMDTLTPWGLDVLAFGSAKETLKYLENRTFDIIIIDICMPDMNGIDLVHALREKNFTQPMIGLSSLGSKTGEDLFDEFYVKPVSKSDLFTTIRKMLKAKTSSIKLERKKIDFKIYYNSKNI